MGIDPQTLQRIGKRVHGLTRRYETEQNCKRKTVVTLTYHFKGGGMTEIGRAVNGPMFDDQTRCTDEVGGCGCIHSEFYAITSLLRNGWAQSLGQGNGALYLAVTYSPCTPCANLIVTSQIIRGCFWLEDTQHDLRGIDILKDGLHTAERIDPC
jgi:deoxycytidylate deaminase